MQIDEIRWAFSVHVIISMLVIVYFAVTNYNLKKLRLPLWKLVLYSKHAAIVGTMVFPGPYRRVGNSLQLVNKPISLPLSHTVPPSAFELISGEGIIMSRGPVFISDICGEFVMEKNQMTIPSDMIKEKYITAEFTSFLYKSTIPDWSEIDSLKE